MAEGVCWKCQDKVPQMFSVRDGQRNMLFLLTFSAFTDLLKWFLSVSRHADDTKTGKEVDPSWSFVPVYLWFFKWCWQTRLYHLYQQLHISLQLSNVVLTERTNSNMHMVFWGCTSWTLVEWYVQYHNYLNMLHWSWFSHYFRWEHIFETLK